MMFKTLEGIECYIEKALADVLDKRIYDMMHSKLDMTIICQGVEGSAKSFFMKMIAKYISTKTGTPFTLDNIHFRSDDLIKHADTSYQNGIKYQVNILDESRTDLFSGSTNSKETKRFNNWLSLNRSMNYCNIVILPSVWDLTKYVTLHRATMIITTYMVKDNEGHSKRGYFYVTGTKNKAKLYKVLEKKYTRIPESMRLIRGRFPQTDVIDEKAYEKKKMDFRTKQFTEEEKKEVNFTDMNITYLMDCIKLYKKSFNSKSKEYKMGEVVTKKLILLRENTSGTRITTPYTKGSDNYV